MGWRPYWSLYLKQDLGASISIIGMLSMIQLSSQLLFQLPGGVLADKFGRRKLIIFGTSIRLIPPIVYILAKNWVQIIPGLLIEAFRSLYMPAQNAIIADSLPPQKRGTGYGTYRMIISFPRLFMPFLGGVIMDKIGYKEGIRIFLLANIIAIIISIVAKIKLLTETLNKRSTQSSKVTTLSAIMVPKTIWIMVVVSVLSGFALRMVNPFISVYAIEVIGLTNTQLGLVSTLGGLIMILLSLPGGILADHYGRKPVILTSKILTSISTYAISLSRMFWQYMFSQLISSIGSSLGGRGGATEMVGGPAWEAMVADLVPKEKRATAKGLIATFTGVIGAPSSWIGGYLWLTYSAQTPFWLSMIFGLIASLIFIIFINEPNRREY